MNFSFVPETMSLWCFVKALSPNVPKDIFLVTVLSSLLLKRSLVWRSEGILSQHCHEVEHHSIQGEKDSAEIWDRVASCDQYKWSSVVGWLTLWALSFVIWGINRKSLWLFPSLAGILWKQLHKNYSLGEWRQLCNLSTACTSYYMLRVQLGTTQHPNFEVFTS